MSKISHLPKLRKFGEFWAHIAYFWLAWLGRNHFLNTKLSKLSKEISDPTHCTGNHGDSFLQFQNSDHVAQHRSGLNVQGTRDNHHFGERPDDDDDDDDDDTIQAVFHFLSISFLCFSGPSFQTLLSYLKAQGHGSPDPRTG